MQSKQPKPFAVEACRHGIEHNGMLPCGSCNTYNPSSTFLMQLPRTEAGVTLGAGFGLTALSSNLKVSVCNWTWVASVATCQVTER